MCVWPMLFLIQEMRSPRANLEGVESRSMRRTALVYSSLGRTAFQLLWFSVFRLNKITVWGEYIWMT